MKEYTVEIGGLEHTVLLTDEDAKRIDAKAVTPKNKQATPKNKADAGPRNSG